jgi:hypothetical protein
MRIAVVTAVEGGCRCSNLYSGTNDLRLYRTLIANEGSVERRWESIEKQINMALLDSAVFVGMIDTSAKDVPLRCRMLPSEAWYGARNSSGLKRFGTAWKL